ncbi:hypothetical protein Y032_0003g1438 [Ancylostoma ceylanicum]|uniref:Uncharacterized protein n=1 Tax=Ancylostoma ceylanicum TaxID=53326 RepID=A0A016VXX7_9BILA|nr:hypothetical protein Y032_0003g1438 [Ancylostoma ceylanicum]
MPESSADCLNTSTINAFSNTAVEELEGMEVMTKKEDRLWPQEIIDGARNPPDSSSRRGLCCDDVIKSV